MLLSVYMSAKYSILSPKKHSLTAVIYPATHSGSTQLEFWMRSRTYSRIFAFPHFCQFLQAKWQGEYISGPQICSHLSYISLASGVAELSPQISSTFTQTAIDSLKFLSHAHRHRHTHTHIAILGARYNGLHYLGSHFFPTLQSASRTSRCSLLADVLYLAQKAALAWCSPYKST